MKHTYYTTCPDCGAHLDPCEPCDCHVELAGKAYPVSGMVEHETLGPLPVVDMADDADYCWQKSCLEDRLRHPELYAAVLGEDVPAVIARLRSWLADYEKESAAQE